MWLLDKSGGGGVERSMYVEDEVYEATVSMKKLVGLGYGKGNGKEVAVD